MDTEEQNKFSSCHARCPALIKNHLLITLVLGGVILGFCLGFGLRAVNPSEDSLMWLGLPGEVFMRLLTVTILPIIVSSIISGTASIGPKSNGRIGGISICFFGGVNTVASFLGIIMFFIFRPGQENISGPKPFEKTITTHLQTQDMFADLIRNIFPDNIVTASFEKAQTKYTVTEVTMAANGSNLTMLRFSRTIQSTSGTNIIGVIFMCAVVGMAAGKVGHSAKPFVSFFEACSEIFLSILKWFIWSTPVGVISLIASSVASVDDLERTFHSLGMFIIAFTIGILIQQLILVPTFFFAVWRQNPFKFLFYSLRPMMSAFGPPSSAVGIPDALEVAESRYNIDKRVSRFVIPFGAQECRYGSAFFVALSAMFLLAIDGIRLGVVQVFVIGFLTAVGSLAIPSVPSSSLVITLIVLSSVGISGQNIGLLLALEWYTDRLRTMSNILVALLGAFVTEKFCKFEEEETDNTNMRLHENRTCAIGVHDSLL